MVDSVSDTKQRIYKICLTGGPCAGKTTALTHLRDHLTEKGFKVYTVPEVPTLTMTGGGMIIMAGLTKEKTYKFQQLLMKAQMNLEDYFYELAVLYGKNSVILYDRGVMDPKAYMDEESWQAVLDDSGWNAVYLRDKRYDVVIHLVTAADGAEKFYTLENNAARYEDIPTAKWVDQKLIGAWGGHPHHIIIDNSVSSFEEKIKRTVNGVEKFIGIPVTQNLFLKFLIESWTFPEGFDYQEFDVEEIYLKPRDPQVQIEYIRKRGSNNAYSYAHTYRMKSDDKTKRCELKENISAREYINLSAYKEPGSEVIKKRRYTFIYEKQSFVMETFLYNKVTLLRIDAPDGQQAIKFPEFLKVGKDVTRDEEFATKKLARKQSIDEKSQEQ